MDNSGYILDRSCLMTNCFLLFIHHQLIYNQNYLKKKRNSKQYTYLYTYLQEIL